MVLGKVMEITAEQKALLQLVDSDIENCFSTGVTQSGAYLPALTGYDRIPAQNRVLGRQGILSTFAGFLKELPSYIVNSTKAFVPSVQTLTLENGYSTGALYTTPDPDQVPSYYKNAINEIVLQGIVYSGSAPSFTTIATLPVGYRPNKTYILSAVRGLAATITVYVATDGRVFCPVATSGGEWIALDSLRFRAA